jgi:hypothetical protein
MRSLPAWLPNADLACAVAAGALWYLRPEFGPWPLLLVLSPWLVRLVAAGRLGWATPFDLPLVLFVATAGLAVWSAYDRTVAWSKFWQIVGGVFLFYALANGLAQAGQTAPTSQEPAGEPAEDEGQRAAGRRARRRAEQYAWLLAVFGAGVAVYFLATHDWDVYPGKFPALEQLGRELQAPLPALPGHRLHPNVAGGLMAMMLPFSVLVTGLAGRRLSDEEAFEPHEARRLAWSLFLGLALLVATSVGLLLSSSRGAWLALTAAGLLAFWGMAARQLSRRRPKRRSWLLFGGLGAAFLAGWLLIWLWPPALTGALNVLPDLASGLRRADLYRNSLILAMDYPLIGAGLGGFMMLHSTYSFLTHVGFSVHSHNLFLNVAIEQGLLALLALAWMWLLVGEAIWRDVAGRMQRRRRRSSRSNPAGLGWGEADVTRPGALSPNDSQSAHRRRPGPPALDAAALSLVVMLVHGLVDDPLYGSRAVLLLFAPLAFAAPALTAAQPAALREQWPIWALVVGLVVLIGLLWWRPLLSTVEANLAAVRQSRAELALYSWPEWPIQDELRRSLEMGPVVAGYERALELNPSNGSANRRLGQIELSLGAYEAALGHLEAAYQSTPWDNATQQLLGEAYLVNGRAAEGQALWADVNDVQGQLGIRAFWYDHIGDEVRLAAVQAAMK